MNKYAIFARLSLGSLIVMLGFTLLLGLLPSELFKYELTEQLIGIVALLLTAGFFLPGFYLWVTGFSRYKESIGYWSPRFVLYLVFTILYAIYLEFRNERAE